MKNLNTIFKLLIIFNFCSNELWLQYILKPISISWMASLMVVTSWLISFIASGSVYSFQNRHIVSSKRWMTGQFGFTYSSILFSQDASVRLGRRASQIGSKNSLLRWFDTEQSLTLERFQFVGEGWHERSSKRSCFLIFQLSWIRSCTCFWSAS